MTIFYLDSSAWVKRYQKEAGSDWIGRLWMPDFRFACASIGLIEVLCTVARRHAGHNVDQALSDAVFADVGHDFDRFLQIALDDRVVGLAKSLSSTRRLRGADCIHLASAMSVRDSLGASVTFIASDAELLAAASAEGFFTLDPPGNPQIPSP